MRISVPALVVGVVLLSGCAAQQTGTSRPAARADVQHIVPEGNWPYPFSPAVRVGNLLFLSGVIGTRPDRPRELVPGGIEAETRQVMENIRAVLERSGSSLDRVVKCTVMLADMREWERLNAVYVTYFPGPKPARSALGANGLALGARVEIECIATVG